MNTYFTRVRQGDSLPQLIQTSGAFSHSPRERLSCPLSKGRMKPKDRFNVRDHGGKRQKTEDPVAHSQGSRG